MAIRIVEIHPAEQPEELNTEWFLLENQGQRPFSTRNCTLSVRRKGHPKRILLGTLDPGFTLAPGDKVRVSTGTPGRKSHGKAPEDGITPYSLLLNESILRGPGCQLFLALRGLPVTSATFDPDAPGGVAAR